MRIALISKLWEETGKKSVGGTGMGVGLLADGLVKKGHKVTVFATGDSKTKARLSAVTSRAFGDHYLESLDYLNIAQAYERASEFDLLHFHVEHRSLPFSRLTKTPTIHTIRYGEFFPDEMQVLKEYRKENFTAISRAVEKFLPFLKWQGVVYNGLELRDYPFKPFWEKDLLIFNGRMSPQKGPDMAIRVAKKLGMRLEMIGKTTPFDEVYLREKVWPYVDGKQIKYLGVLKFEEKVKFMGRGAALLHPVSYLEAFGNALIEALACGTPVVAFNLGAVGEIIENGRQGFLVKTEEEMVEAVKNISAVRREGCRARVEKKFTAEQMVSGYEKIYREIVNKNTIYERHPKLVSGS